VVRCHISSLICKELFLLVASPKFRGVSSDPPFVEHRCVWICGLFCLTGVVEAVFVYSPFTVFEEGSILTQDTRHNDTTTQHTTFQFIHTSYTYLVLGQQLNFTNLSRYKWHDSIVDTGHRELIA